MTGPRDVQVGPNRPILRWRKRKWLCPSVVCERKVFTESVPGVPARARVTPRAKAAMATAVLEEDRSVAAVAGEYGCGWHTVHDDVITTAEEALDVVLAPVRVLGIDETRRGKAKWEHDPVAGRRVWVDRWDTGLVDLTGDQGLLAQVNGRSSAVAIDWLATQEPAWRAQITHLAIDLSPAYARVARLALPEAIVIADRFHVVKKANDMVDAVRRRVTLAQRGRRGRKDDVEWINRRRLLRGAERLTGESSAPRYLPSCCPPTPTRTWPRPGSPKSFCVNCSRAPNGADCATRSPPPWTASTDSARPARCPRSSASPVPSRPGRPRSSLPCRPG
jgi:transposase